MQPYGALAASGRGSLEVIILVGGSSPALLPEQVLVNNVQCSLTNATS